MKSRIKFDGGFDEGAGRLELGIDAESVGKLELGIDAESVGKLELGIDAERAR